jgi:hypothetical protein
LTTRHFNFQAIIPALVPMRPLIHAVPDRRFFLAGRQKRTVNSRKKNWDLIANAISGAVEKLIPDWWHCLPLYSDIVPSLQSLSEAHFAVRKQDCMISQATKVQTERSSEAENAFLCRVSGAVCSSPEFDRLANCAALGEIRLCNPGN